MLVRKLDENDIDIIKELDSHFNNISLSELITDEDGSIYGLFNDENQLIGYTYIESAEEASSSKYWKPDSIMISNLSIIEEYKNPQYIEYFIEFLIGIIGKVNIFLNMIEESDKTIYDKFGFIDDNNGSMVKIYDTNNEKE